MLCPIMSDLYAEFNKLKLGKGHSHTRIFIFLLVEILNFGPADIRIMYLAYVTMAIVIGLANYLAILFLIQFLTTST